MKQCVILLAAALASLSACGENHSPESLLQNPQNPLHIPELIDSRATSEIELVMQHGEHEFYAGVPSETKGFNGTYLGPTIRLYRGSDANITFVNKIGEPTSVHGHGLHVSGEIDGGPQGVITDGERWPITIPVRQEAGTSWYHPHLMGKTAHHVHAGLAGLYVIEDENSQALDLPKTYGVNDIPLIVQDRSFTNGVMNEYAVPHNNLDDGLREETLVVNGTLGAYHTVPQGWVRLRLVNGSNARFYRFHFGDEQPFFKIATEGGFLNQPVEMASIEMAPGERNEILIDLSEQTSATLVADLLPADPEDAFASLFTTLPQASVVELRVDTTLQAAGAMPNTLNDIAYFDRAEATQIRSFHLGMGDGEDSVDPYSVNGRSMDMSVISHKVRKGDVEIWRITADDMPHPFHMHGVSFQILTHHGAPTAEADKGWKDTVVVTDELTEIILRFDHVAPEEYPYMFHCHIFEHEDFGMMGQFTVVE